MAQSYWGSILSGQSNLRLLNAERQKEQKGDIDIFPGVRPERLEKKQQKEQQKGNMDG